MWQIRAELIEKRLKTSGIFTMPRRPALGGKALSREKTCADPKSPCSKERF